MAKGGPPTRSGNKATSPKPGTEVRLVFGPGDAGHSNPIMVIACKRLESWNEIKEHDHRGWIYRGHPREDWVLKTTLERLLHRPPVSTKMTSTGLRTQLESELLREFRRACYQYMGHVPDRGSTLEWLALMQHHGAPTRLLDFTYSIYVAAYFALERAEETDCAVWAVDAKWALDQSVEALRRAGKTEPDRLHAVPDEDKEKRIHPLLFEEPFIKCAVPLNAFRLNPRLRLQKGISIVPGDGTISFMENLQALPGHDAAEHVYKLIIPLDRRAEALEALFYMNITRATLFPDLDGYARSLAVYHSSFDPDNWA